MISAEIARMVTAALHFRAGGEDPADLFLYTDLEQEVIEEIEPGDVDYCASVISELVQAVTTSLITLSADDDPRVLWQSILSAIGGQP